MKNTLHTLRIIGVVLLLTTLAACGPKEVGEGMSSDYYNASSREPSTSVAEHSRYPTDGTAPVQRRLFLMNQPVEQQRVIQRHRDYMNHRLGINPDQPQPMDEQPKQRSPFRDF